MINFFVSEVTNLATQKFPFKHERVNIFEWVKYPLLSKKERNDAYNLTFSINYFFHHITYTMAYKIEPLFIFLILLLGLILCSFLISGNRSEGMVTLTSERLKALSPNTYTGMGDNDVGITVTANSAKDGGYTFVVKDANGHTLTTFIGGPSLAETPENAKLMKEIMSYMYNTNPPPNPVPRIFRNSDGMLYIVFYNGKVYISGDKMKYFSEVSIDSSTNANTSGNNSGSVSGSSSSSKKSEPNNNQDNYNHFHGSSTPTVFYGPDGTTAKVTRQNGTGAVIVSDTAGNHTIYLVKHTHNKNKTDNTGTTYYGPNGSIATLYSDNQGDYILQVQMANGNTIMYSSKSQQTFNTSMDNPSSPPHSTTSNNNGGMGSPFDSNGNSSAYLIGGGASNNIRPIGSNAAGIPRSMIPAGDEDLYILKSEIVPPVCPACPSPIVTCPKGGSGGDPPPPCPPCARCPEPNFECKKVPNYKSADVGGNYYGGGGPDMNTMGGGGSWVGGGGSKYGGWGGTGTGSDVLPVPVLSSFSSFGM